MSETKNKEISKSKAKRLAQETARKQQKARKALATFWAIVIPVAIIALIVGLVMYRKSKIVDFSKYLTDQGTIANININDYVTTSYQNMSFSEAELMPSDYAINIDIENLTYPYSELQTDSSLTVEPGSKINITYEAFLDGDIPYESVSANEGGRDLTIGYKTLGEEVDNALTGAHPGDVVSIDLETTYVEATESTDAISAIVTYNVTIEGIYVRPEFNDEFVAEYLPEYESAEAYRQYLVQEAYDSTLRTKIVESLSINCVVSAIPDDYYNNTIKVLKKENQDTFQYYQEMYAMYGLELGSIYELFGCANEAEYNNLVANEARNQVEYILQCQAIFEAAGLTNTPEEVRAYYFEQGMDELTYNDNIAVYGYNYMASAAMTEKVITYLMETVTITK